MCLSSVRNLKAKLGGVVRSTQEVDVRRDCCHVVELSNVLGIIHVIRGHKNPKLLLDKNEFVINHKFRDKTRWRCTAYYKTKCRCFLVTYGRVVNVFHTHNHNPSVEVCNYDNLFSQKVSFVYVIRGIKNPKLLLDNCEFVCNRKGKKKTWWRCTSYYKTKCKAILMTHGRVVEIINEHNHVPNREAYDLSNIFKHDVIIRRRDSMKWNSK
ncbi:FLYWCH domain containing protein [Asbolus verrucosus]|uniref:FLYWCH domain containing protein n=1 Tax=Asbolus verrucosus TaxID=1661398 RepID=A0A482W3N1_ASBVE|nr:FLYWCH domain containing protein [Asbolus verrucosus]